MTPLDLFLPLAKVDLDQRIVTGVATAEQPDRAGEICDYASSKPYFEKWSSGALAASRGKSMGAVRAMHGKVAAGKLTDIAFDDDAKRVVVAAKIVDDDEWNKVLEGVYTGFSQGGRYVKRWTDPETGLTRYTADPQEISLVDLPCLPDATFEVVKDGVVEKRAFARRPAAPPDPAEPTPSAKAAEPGEAPTPSPKRWAPWRTRPGRSNMRSKRTSASARRSTPSRPRWLGSRNASPRSKPSPCPQRRRCAPCPRAPTAAGTRSTPTTRCAALPRSRRKSARWR